MSFASALPGHALASPNAYPLPTSLGVACIWWSADHSYEPIPATGYVTNLSDASWSKTNLTVTAGIDDPFGGTSAFRLTDTVDGGAVGHTLQEPAVTASTTLSRFDVWLRAGTFKHLQLHISSGGHGISSMDLLTGTVGPEVGSRAYHTGSGPNGWKRYTIFAEPASGQNITLTLRNLAESQVYQGDGTGTIDIYLESDAYKARVVQDADGVSHKLDDTVKWPRTNIASVVGGQTDPFGGTDAYLITEGSPGLDVAHQIDAASPNLLAAPLQVDIWLKAGTTNWCGIRLGAGLGGDIFARINLGAKTATPNGGCVATLKSVAAGGWQLWNVSTGMATVTSATLILVVSDSGSFGYVGNGTLNFFAYLPLGSVKQRRVHFSRAVGTVPGLPSDSAAYRLFQATDSLRPILQADTFNGKPCLAFDGSNDFLANTLLPSLINFATIPWTLVMLLDSADPAGNTPTFFQINSAGSGLRKVSRNTSDEIRTDWISSTGAGTNYAHNTGISGAPHAIAMVDYGSTRAAFRDGVKFASDPRANTSVPGAEALNQIMVGRDAAVGNWSNMRVRDIALYPTALTDPQVRLVSNNMRVRAGLAPV